MVKKNNINATNAANDKAYDPNDKGNSGVDGYYSLDLNQGDLDENDADDFKDHTTDLGGAVDESMVVDQSTVGSIVGMAGHPGIDEGTD